MNTAAEPRRLRGGARYAAPGLLKHHPKSFLKLILLGFMLVTLPLILALINSAVSIDRLADQSRRAVYQAAQIAHGSRVLADEITTMERSVRQALILGDASLLEGYLQAHAKFESTAQNLAELSLRSDQKTLLAGLQTSEQAIHRKVVAVGPSLDEMSAWVGDFEPLLESARTFSAAGNALIEHEVDAMQDMAGQARQIVVWQLIGLIPFVLLLALGFFVLIARPIRQIDEAIRNMGEGELSKPVVVEGPQDLSYLGDRLDWMRRRLVELEAQKARFLRHVSHELKTPLTAIREGSDLLAEGVVGELSAKQQQVAKILHGNSVQLQKRIEDLLSFSALQSEKSALVRRRIELKQVLDGVLQDHRLAILNKGLKVAVDCPDLALEGDQQKVRIIVDNLLSNAVKYSPSGGRIGISAGEAGGSMRLDVADSGPGVDPVDRERIFEPFFQGRRSPEGHTRGTGLGLAIAREYALAHGGNIELVEQTAPGARFRVTLPTVYFEAVQ